MTGLERIALQMHRMNHYNCDHAVKEPKVKANERRIMSHHPNLCHSCGAPWRAQCDYCKTDNLHTDPSGDD